MRGWLPRAVSAAVVVASMLAQAAVGQASCPCGAVEDLEAAAVHRHHSSEPAEGPFVAAASDRLHADDRSSATPAPALDGCCCARFQAVDPVLPGARPAGVSIPGRAAVPLPPWTGTATVELAMTGHIRFLLAAPATAVARPARILRI